MPEKRFLSSDFAIAAVCILLVIAGTLPVLFSFSPLPSSAFFSQSFVIGTAGKALTLLFLLAFIFLIAKFDTSIDNNKFLFYCGLLLLSFLLTYLHYHGKDVFRINWQIEQYTKVLAGEADVPHHYRFVPQGLLWWVVLLNGDFIFSYVLYRFFFTFVVCLSLYKLSRLYNPHKDSLLVVLCYGIFYPLSIAHYLGNLLDPMFHSVFILIMIYCCKKKFWQVFFLLSLGMFIKETVILAVPCYYLLNMESLHLRDRKLILKLSCLFFWCLLIFLTCRIPFGFRFDLKTLNNVNGLMVLTNLGFPQPPIEKLLIPVYLLYLHPVLFIFMWFPILIFYRKFVPRSLYYSCFYVGISIYVTNLCFGWNYESRNFIPVLAILLVSTATALNRSNVRQISELQGQ